VHASCYSRLNNAFVQTYEIWRPRLLPLDVAVDNKNIDETRAGSKAVDRSDMELREIDPPSYPYRFVNVTGDSLAGEPA